MTVDPVLLALGREAVVVALLVSAPPLLLALAVGLAVGVLQAATQVHEPTLAVVPRLAAVLAGLALSGPWVGARLVRFAASCLDLLSRSTP